MTEQEYIDASNLARVRSTMNVLRDVCLCNKREQELMRKAYIALTKLEEILSNKMSTVE